MIKIILILLIVLGGFGLMSRYAPQFLGLTLFHIGEYAISGGVVLIGLLLYAGFKCVNS